MAMGPDGPTGYVTSKPTVRRLFIQPILLRSVGVRVAEQWRGIELVSYASTDAPAPREGWSVLHDADQPPSPLRWLDLSKTRTAPRGRGITVRSLPLSRGKASAAGHYGTAYASDEVRSSHRRVADGCFAGRELKPPPTAPAHLGFVPSDSLRGGFRDALKRHATRASRTCWQVGRVDSRGQGWGRGTPANTKRDG